MLFLSVLAQDLHSRGVFTCSRLESRGLGIHVARGIQEGVSSSLPLSLSLSLSLSLILSLANLVRHSLEHLHTLSREHMILWSWQPHGIAAWREPEVGSSWEQAKLPG